MNAIVITVILLVLIGFTILVIAAIIIALSSPGIEDKSSKKLENREFLWSPNKVKKTYPRMSEDILRDHLGPSIQYENVSDYQFEDEIYMAHNYFRKKHNCPPLKISAWMQRVATEWAYHILTINGLKYRLDNDYGENLFYDASLKINQYLRGIQPARTWYSEILIYDFSNPENEMEGVANFTQLIWKHTEYVGCGRALAKGRVAVVCNYQPPGNIIGRYEKNVPIPEIIQNLLQQLIMKLI